MEERVGELGVVEVHALVSPAGPLRLLLLIDLRGASMPLRNVFVLLALQLH